MAQDVNLREMILELLLAVTRDGMHSHVALKQMLDKYRYLTKQERSFVSRVFLGTLEHMIWIDYIVDQCSSVKSNKMKPVIRNILRSGVYQLKYMDAVPDSAAVNEAVKLAKKRGFGSLKGFVNGVLRGIARKMDEIPLPDWEAEPVAWLSVRYSMPEWIVKQWLLDYPMEQVEEMLASFQQEAPTSIRVNTALTTREQLIRRLRAEGVAAEEDSRLPEALTIQGFDSIESLASFREGLFYVQDISSMEAAHLAHVHEGDYVLDVCAAPGGKSMHVAELLQGTGMVEARDVTPAKVERIRENIRRCRLTNVRAAVADATCLRTEDVERADVVMADVPCSGLGVIAKKPDIKYHMTQEKQQELIALQRRILHTVSSYVKPGGAMIYSTCTICRDENEGNVQDFLQGHPEFSLGSQRQILPGAGRQDGFFLARLIKERHGQN